jgi:hypothetical protein
MLAPNSYAAIDPLALLLPSNVYQHLIEKWHPHVEKTALLEAAKAMSPEERSFALARARTLIAYGTAVEEALASLN